ncbi:MAG TPA: HIT domain-containing protein [Acidimicrobiales bacterium]|nr:HIT domain-containing protein [Acidimicrobiales bacterium]
MSLEHLWAGWRSQYVISGPPPDRGAETAVEGDRDPGARPHDRPDEGAACVFCRIAASGPPAADNGILWMGECTFAVLNAYPYASGHLMVLPTRHVQTLAELSEGESAEMWSALRLGVAALEAAYGPEGINLGANLGRAAGAGIPRHLHLHAVPRWVGDTNFMTTVAGARVLPEALTVTWERLTAAWPG